MIQRNYSDFKMISHLKQLLLCLGRRKAAVSQSHSKLHQRPNWDAHFNPINVGFFWLTTNVTLKLLRRMAASSQINSPLFSNMLHYFCLSVLAIILKYCCGCFPLLSMWVLTQHGQLGSTTEDRFITRVTVNSVSCSNCPHHATAAMLFVALQLN